MTRSRTTIALALFAAALILTPALAQAQATDTPAKRKIQKPNPDLKVSLEIEEAELDDGMVEIEGTMTVKNESAESVTIDPNKIAGALRVRGQKEPVARTQRKRPMKKGKKNRDDDADGGLDIDVDISIKREPVAIAAGESAEIAFEVEMKPLDGQTVSVGSQYIVALRAGEAAGRAEVTIEED